MSPQPLGPSGLTLSSAEGVTGSSSFSQQLMRLWKQQEGQEEKGAQVILQAFLC